MIDRGFMSGTQHGATVWQENAGSAGPHRVVLALFKGEVAFGNGERGTYAGVEVITLDEADEPFTGTHTFVLADGSTSTQSFDGIVTTRTEPARISGAGTWRIVAGTGRLAGLRGGGPFTWSIDGERYSARFSAEGSLRY